MAGRMHKEAAMMMTLLVLAGFVAIGITVMLTLANALLQPVTVENPELESQVEAQLTHRAA